MYNQLQYLAATWRPPHVPLTPPGPWAYVIRAVITPAAFMAAAFLAPLGEGMAAQIQSEAHHLTAAAFKAASAQWKRRLREMQKSGQDITAALVELVEDPSERRVIATIHRAMHGDTPVSRAIAEERQAPEEREPESARSAPYLFNRRAVAPASLMYTADPAISPEDPDPDPDGTYGRARRRPSKRSSGATSSRRRDSGARSREASARWLRETDKAADILTTEPLISTRQLARRMRVSVARATEVRRAVQPERPTREQLEALTDSNGEERTA